MRYPIRGTTNIVPLFLIGIFTPFALAYLNSNYLNEARLNTLQGFCVLFIIGVILPWCLHLLCRGMPKELAPLAEKTLLGATLVLGIITWVPVPWNWGIGLVALGAWIWKGKSEWIPRASSKQVLFIQAGLLLSLTSYLHIVHFHDDSRIEPLRTTNQPPLVILIFDQMSLPLMLDENGEINSKRFPNFHRFSKESDWFVRTSSLRSATIQSVPMILSGRYLREDPKAVSLRYYPENLFTWLAGDYEIRGFEQYTKLCPTDLCTLRSPSHGLSSVGVQLADWALWWGNQNLPNAWQKGLPSTKEAPFDFWGLSDRPKKPRMTIDRLPRVQHDFKLAKANLTLTQGRFHYFHFMVPHQPFQFYPSGSAYFHQRHHIKPTISLTNDTAGEETANHFFSRYQLQMAYADWELGNILNRLQSDPAYDSAWIAVLSDHGMAFRANQQTRPSYQQPILPEVYSVPLMVKRPHQRLGRRLLNPVEIVDLAPTLLGDIGASPMPKMDGQSLYHPRKNAGKIEHFVKRKYAYETIEHFDPVEIAKRYHQRFNNHLPLARAYGWGEGSAFLGKKLDGLKLGSPSTSSWQLAHREAIPKSWTWALPGLLALRVQPQEKPISVVLVAGHTVTNAFRIPPGVDAYTTSVLVPEEFARTPSDRWELYEVRDGKLLRMPISQLG